MLTAAKTLDSGGQDDKDVRRHPEPGNPLTGPFYIEGAEPNDAILVRFRKVRLNRNWGYSGGRLGLYALTPDYVNAASGLDLHRFKWLDDGAIGSLPLEWNWLVGEYDGLLIFEAPDEQSAVALMARLAKLGNVRTRTLRAFYAAEMKQILAKVK